MDFVFYLSVFFIFIKTKHNNQQKSHKITIAANVKILQQSSQDIIFKFTLSDLNTINTQSSKSGKHTLYSPYNEMVLQKKKKIKNQTSIF